MDRVAAEADAAQRLITEIVRITATPGCEDLVLRHFKVERDGADLLEHIQSLVDGAGRPTSDPGTKVLAEVCAERTAERDEARRVLLAIGEDVYSHPYRYTLAMLRRVLGIPFHGVDIAAPDIRAALRKVCGAAQ